jgi:hypothetical protein
VNQAADVLEKLERKTEKGPKKEPQNEMKNNVVEERKVLKVRCANPRKFATPSYQYYLSPFLLVSVPMQYTSIHIITP